MAAEQEALIRLAELARGDARHGRVLVRRVDQPAYLDLTADELAVVDELRAAPSSVAEYLSRHLGGSGRIGFKEAVSLLMRLYQNGFVLDASSDMMRQLADFAGKAQSSTAGGVARGVGIVATLVDAPLVSFAQCQVHPFVSACGRVLVSPVLLLVQALVIGTVLVAQGQLDDALAPAAWAALLSEPLALLVKACGVFSLAASFLALMQVAALSGAGARFVGGRLRLTALCVVRLAVDDDDAFLMPRGKLLRYQASTLLLPWTMAALLWSASSAVEVVAGSATLAASAFALLGALSLCPLYRSPVVKVAEGALATRGLITHANHFLQKGLISGLFGAQDADGDKARQAWLSALACLSLVWLYAMSLVFIDALMGAAAGLWIKALGVRKSPLEGAAAFMLFLILAGAGTLPFLRLALIPAQNLFAVAALPLRRARRGITSFYDGSMSPTAAIVGFLKDIPILVGLSDAQLAQLVQSLKFRRYPRGAAIIQRGEDGHEFFILAEGGAQVVLGGGGTREEVVDVLSPGDSFGEIALVEKVRRTATIRAMTSCKVLVLQRSAFDALFPEGSDERAKLTSVIRQVKLVLESQALSHLAPRQIRELLKASSTVSFQGGDFLIHENTVGDRAFLVATGEVQVVRAGRELTTLSRGALVGAISLIKDIRRTASVRAKTEVSCLEIDKQTFLRMCMSNVFVALLVADLADRQLQQTTGETSAARAS